MLQKILQKSTCAACRYCCVFERTSLGELPHLEADAAKRIEPIFPEMQFENHDAHWKSFSLKGTYRTDNPRETLPCPFLDSKTGCRLSDDEKPLECRIWPFRVMERDGRTVLALCIDCPGIKDRERALAFARTELREKLLAIRAEKPLFMQPFRGNYIEVCDL